MNYNDSQERSIEHNRGPFLCLAGPGAGKTTVLTKRICNLIQKYQVSPASILVVTFTKASAREMKERFLRLMGEEHTEVTFGTFHSVFYGILRHAYHLSGKNIIREEQKYELLRTILSRYSLEIDDEKEFMEGIMQEISLVKTNEVNPDHYYSSNCPDDVFREIYRCYTEKCKLSRLLDFDDMLVYCYELLSQRKDILKGWQRKFRYILVDEFQDINHLQYKIIKLLSAPENNLFIVGDDDQSIYGFRGAKPEIMLNFPKDFTQVKQEILSCNYRSTSNIVKTGQKVIVNNKHRFQKEIYTDNPAGEPIEIKVFQTRKEEELYLKDSVLRYYKAGHEFEDIAVLYRTNLGARFLVETFMEYQIPFHMRDMLPNLYEHWTAKNILSYIRVASGDRSRKEFLQIMNRPNRYLSREALDSSEVSFEGLRWFYEEKEWMCDRIDKLEEDLKTIKQMTPYGAVNYIRHGIGYDEYLKDYASYRKLKVEDLYEVLQELQDSAKGHKDFGSWFLQMERYTEKLKEQAKQQMENQEGVTISTLHSIKGLEYPSVYIMDANEGIMPYQKAVLEEAMEEERRLFYVGITRAKKHLHIYAAKEHHDKKLEISRFLTEIEDKEDAAHGAAQGRYILHKNP